MSGTTYRASADTSRAISRRTWACIRLALHRSQVARDFQRRPILFHAIRFYKSDEHAPWAPVTSVAGQETRRRIGIERYAATKCGIMNVNRRFYPRCFALTVRKNESGQDLVVGLEGALNPPPNFHEVHGTLRPKRAYKAKQNHKQRN